MHLPWKKIILHLLLPLVTGFLIYVIARPDNWIMQQLFPGHVPKRIITPSSPGYIKLIAYSGADFCWSYSFASALFIWKKASGPVTPLFFLAVVLLIISFEVVQLLVPSRFTFDSTDLIAACLAVVLSWLFTGRDK